MKNKRSSTLRTQLISTKCHRARPILARHGGVHACAFSTSSGEAEAGGSELENQPDLPTEFQGSQSRLRMFKTVSKQT